MFIHGFHKMAALTATVSPEDYFEHVHEKDPYVGAALGGKAGALLGAIKGKKGNKLKSAVVGALIGEAGGAAIGHGAKRVMRKYHAHKLRQYVHDLNLRSTPSRKSSGAHED